MADQFENHLRAVLGYPLGRTNCVGGFAMLNLLGPSAEDYSLAGDQVDLPIPPRSAHLHWYGKESIRPFRKLGHLNGRVDELSHLPELLSEMQRCSADWSEKIVKTIKSDSIFLNKENS